MTDLEAFARGYNRSFVDRGIELSTPMTTAELARYDDVYGIESDGRLVGGFVINRAPKRLRDFAERGHLSATTAEVDAFGGIEVTAVWRDASLGRVRLWLNVLARLLATPSTGGIVAAAYPKHGLYDSYHACGPVVLHAAAHARELEVFRFTKAQFFMTVVRGLAERLPRPVALPVPRLGRVEVAK